MWLLHVFCISPQQAREEQDKCWLPPLGCWSMAVSDVSWSRPPPPRRGTSHVVASSGARLPAPAPPRPWPQTWPFGASRLSAVPAALGHGGGTAEWVRVTRAQGPVGCARWCHHTHHPDSEPAWEPNCRAAPMSTGSDASWAPAHSCRPSFHGCGALSLGPGPELGFCSPVSPRS